MTTETPSCSLLTPVTKSTTAGKPAYTVLNTVLWRRVLRPPSNPPHSTPLPQQRADGGRRPGRRPPNPRAGALVAEPRPVVVAARVTRAERAAASAAAEAVR